MTGILRSLDKESESDVEDFLCESLKYRLYFVNAGNHHMVLVRGMRGRRLSKGEACLLCDPGWGRCLWEKGHG